MTGMLAGGVIADTHPSAYLIHKYWARKPHNVVSSVLQALDLPDGSLVLDPFCGSGVALSEAAKLGLAVEGADINPVAALLSQLMLDPPEPGEIAAAVLPILDEAEKDHLHAFGGTRELLRYCVHATVVRCSGCGRSVSAVDAKRSGRRYLCSNCGTRVNLNLECMTGSRIIQVTTASKEFTDQRTCQDQERLSALRPFENSAFDQAFTVNRRVLAFDGMSTSRLFTPRNWSCVSMVADRLQSLPDQRIREAGLIALTSSVAQASRLIPYRNNLATGGQAWSVPGFWVAPLHLETHPISHFRQRLKKLLRGIEELRGFVGRGRHHKVRCEDAADFLNRIARSKRKASAIFLDPPYGDSVPYLEFSALWNSFLGYPPAVEKDISVSDRQPKEQAWTQYRQALANILQKAVSALSHDGRLVCTFNNHDMRAWRALLGGIQAAGLHAVSVVYQHPAVVSAKAQLAPEGSYVGDFYCIFARGPVRPASSLDLIRPALQKVAAAHGGAVSSTLVIRVALTEALRCNIAADLIEGLHSFVDNLFGPEVEGIRKWCGTSLQPSSEFAEALKATATRELESGPLAFGELYARLCLALTDLGIPDPFPLRRMLSEYVTFEKDTCRLSKRSSAQLSLLA